jgi:4'-phosphopantetheinyl transferase superfamily
VGVDIERVEEYDAALAWTICAPAEREALSSCDDELLTSLWCAKEALSKALGDALSYEPRRLEAPLLWPGGRAGPWRGERIAAPAAHVAWLCWRDPQRAAS